VLARLPASLQADVVRRLVDLEETDPNVIREVEQAVEMWLQKRQPVRRRVAGEAAVSAILKSAGTSARRQILNNLSAHNRGLAHRFADSQPAPQRFTFKQLYKLPIEALAATVHLASRRASVVALTGMESETVDELLNNLNDGEADELSTAMRQLGPIRLSEIDRAHEELAQLASHLHAEGRLPGVDEVHLTAVA
jgi:flagellar motor switch protein FliG